MLLSNKGVVKQIKVNGLYYGINGECYMSDELGWSTSDYVPAHGEIVIYRESSAPFNTRFKVGDGTTVVGNLDFVDDGIKALLVAITNEEIDTICETTVESAEDVTL